MWEVVNVGKYTCFRSALLMARRHLANHPRLPPIVRYLGPKPRWPNSTRERLDFVLRSGDRFDFSIDPTWSGNPRP